MTSDEYERWLVAAVAIVLIVLLVLLVRGPEDQERSGATAPVAGLVTTA
jgi:hypothetical protein